MKTKTQLSKWLGTASMAALLLTSLTSCDGNKTANNDAANADSKELADEQNDEKFEERKEEKQADFLSEAVDMNMAEMKLSELAQTKATTPRVKELANMMVKDHKKMQTELTALAGKKSVSVPTDLSEDGQDTYNKLNEKTGVDFDKEYCDLMVKKHKDAVDKFEKESEKAEDPDVKNLALAALPNLRMHLDHAKSCEEEVKKMK